MNKTSYFRMMILSNSLCLAAILNAETWRAEIDEISLNSWEGVRLVSEDLPEGKSAAFAQRSDEEGRYPSIFSPMRWSEGLFRIGDAEKIRLVVRSTMGEGGFLLILQTKPEGNQAQAVNYKKWINTGSNHEWKNIEIPFTEFRPVAAHSGEDVMPADHIVARIILDVQGKDIGLQVAEIVAE